MYASSALKKDKNFALRVVQQNGLALSDELYNQDREIVLAAIKQNRRLFDVPKDLLSFHDFMLTVAKLVFSEFKHLDRLDIMMKLVEEYGYLLGFSSDESKNTGMGLLKNKQIIGTQLSDDSVSNGCVGVRCRCCWS